MVTSPREAIAYKNDLPSRAKYTSVVATPGINGMHFRSEIETSPIPIFSRLDPSMFHFQTVGMEPTFSLTLKYSVFWSGLHCPHAVHRRTFSVCETSRRPLPSAATM